VHNGVPDVRGVQAACTLRQELGVPLDRPLIGLVGRFIRDKGQDIAIDALSRLSVPAHLALIGDHATPWGRDMRLRSGFAPARDRIHFVGFRDDVREQLGNCDLVVAPSRREALPLTLIEAAAAGVPVVASRIGGVPEVVLDGKTGILVAPEDPAVLARAIEALIKNPALRALGAYRAPVLRGPLLSATHARRRRGGLSQSGRDGPITRPRALRLAQT
jgi:glycosyltransferase involved in cell wall biosynthesis